MKSRRVLALSVAALLAACGEVAELPEASGYGPSPTLPPPRETALPTVKIAPAVGWPEGATPTPMSGTTVTPFATGLQHPRWLTVLPNGDVLVAESNAPERPAHDDSIRLKVMAWIQGRAGAGVPSADRIVLLRDADRDGTAEVRSVLIENLTSPFGMTLVGDSLYVANTDALVRFPYREGALEIREPGERVADLPAGDFNHHWTKNVIASPDGSRLYVTVGSNSNAAEHGMAMEEGRAAIWEFEPDGEGRIYATGLRNPNGMVFDPAGQLWAVVNERDEIGSDLVPDYITRVREGGFYGWPYSYYGQNIDRRVEAQRPELVESAIVPDYAVGSHTGSLGLAYASAANPGPAGREGFYVGQHGSWNRDPMAGYRVIFIPVIDGRPTGDPVPVLTDFLNDEGEAQGRPVAVVLDGAGGLLVADDVGNIVWRVTATGQDTSSDVAFGGPSVLLASNISR